MRNSQIEKMKYNVNKMENEKMYFKPGDCVILKQNKMMYSPVMLVIRKENSLFKDSPSFKGLRCRWFTSTGLLQEAIFNTKDLILVKNELGE